MPPLSSLYISARAHLDCAVAANLDSGRATAPPVSDAWATAAQQAAVAYVTRCLHGDRPFAVITTGGAPAAATLLDRLGGDFAIREEVHVVRIHRPTDHVPDFLASSLAQLGFEAPQAEPDELHNLLLVFLRHEAANGRKTVFLLEQTERFGPRVLDFLQALSRLRIGTVAPALFVLTGSPTLHRVLDSPAMAALRAWTRERFDLDRGVAWISSPTPGAPQPTANRPRVEAAPGSTVTRMMVVHHNRQVVERRALRTGRFFIGRDSANDVVLPAPYVSRRHAVLLVAETGAYVVDLRSRNGTLVNGRTVQDEALVPGDQITIGGYGLRFELAGPSGSVS